MISPLSPALNAKRARQPYGHIKLDTTKAKPSILEKEPSFNTQEKENTINAQQTKKIEEEAIFGSILSEIPEFTSPSPLKTTSTTLLEEIVITPLNSTDFLIEEPETPHKKQKTVQIPIVTRSNLYQKLTEDLEKITTIQVDLNFEFKRIEFSIESRTKLLNILCKKAQEHGLRYTYDQNVPETKKGTLAVINDIIEAVRRIITRKLNTETENRIDTALKSCINVQSTPT